MFVEHGALDGCVAADSGCEEAKAQESPRFVVYSSIEYHTLGGRYGGITLDFAPDGLYASGVRMRLTGAANGYQYLANTDPWTLGGGP